ncbi:MAG: formimidoylglutamase, partial [Flavicella sp.]
MSLEFLIPLENSFLEDASVFGNDTLAKCIDMHSHESGLPDLEGAKIAIFAVLEGRSAVSNETTGCLEGATKIRSYLYKLFPGNWTQRIVDLGNIPQGASVSDTYFAVKEVVSSLVKREIIPVIIGGGQDLTYANYRAYDSLEQLVNLVAVDAKFDLGVIDAPLLSNSYLSKIVMEQPCNLFNFSNIGYQTYFNHQEEIDLLENLHFDALRLGVSKDLKVLEPIMRDADIVSVDIGALRYSEAPANNNASPNGFYGEEICSISRYAGISDKVTSFGVYEYNYSLDTGGQTAHLIAQTLWYFIEGVNARSNDYPFCSRSSYMKYMVPVESETLIFYKSPKSGRWWMEIHSLEDTKHKRNALIPCTYKDYL